MKLVSSSRRLQSTGPARTGIGLRWRFQAWRSIRLQITRVRGCHAQYRL